MRIHATIVRRQTIADAQHDVVDLGQRMGGAIAYRAHAGHYETVGASSVWNAVRFADDRAGRAVEVLADSLSMQLAAKEETADPSSKPVSTRSPRP